MIHQLYIYIYTYIYYCITWWWSVPNQTVEGGSPLTPMVPAHLSIPLITYRGTGTGHRQCVSSWWPLDWFGYLHKSDWWGVPLVLFIFTDRDRDGLWWPALSGHWLSCTGCCQYLLNTKYLMYGPLLLQFVHLPRTFFLKNGLGYFPWTSFVSHLHTILRIISRSVSGGWTTCLLCNGPILVLCF